MTDQPWQGDACSLVEAFRRGDRSPVEELQATLGAIAESNLNCFAHLHTEQALAAAAGADTSKPFGGVPVGIKELDPVKGWPFTEASLVFADRKAEFTATAIDRLMVAGGAVAVGQTTASEFGGLNVSTTKINGVTHNAWRHGRTAGGSSAGSAAAVAGGLVSIASGGDGGGSIRIPAAYNGLLGMKGTYGRIPRGPYAFMRPNTVVSGCLARSVHDAARYYDVCAGHDPHDPMSIPSSGDWEALLGTHDLVGKRVIVDPGLSGVRLDPGVEEATWAAAEDLVTRERMVMVDHPIALPRLTAQWMMGNNSALVADLGDLWPKCRDDLTDEIQIGLFLSQSLYNIRTAAAAEELRVRANEVFADAYEVADLIICATNPGPAFAAEASMSNPESSFIDTAKSSAFMSFAFRRLMWAIRMGGTVAQRMPTRLLGWMSERYPDVVNMGALTIAANIYGNPSVSIPIGTLDSLPIGMQVMGRHHEDALLFDVALAAERERPWPLTSVVAGCAVDASDDRSAS